MPKVPKQVKEPATDTTAPAEIIPFAKGLAEGKKILAEIEDVRERGHFRLGEIADKIETKYGDRTHAKLAEGWNIAPSCFKRYLSVYRAWKGKNIGAPGAPIVPYSVLRELAGLEDREQIIRDNPNMTRREAERLRREFNGTDSSSSAQQTEPQGSFLKHKRRYLKDICNRQEEVRRKAEEALEDIDEQLDELAQIAGKLTLENLRADAKVVVELAEVILERRRQLELEDETEQAEPEDADASAQVGA